MSNDCNQNKSFVLRPMVEADILACANVAYQAFLSDRHTQLKAANPTNPYNHEEGTKAHLQSLFSTPHSSTVLTVAEDATTHEILGWVGWGLRGFGPFDHNEEHSRAQRSSTIGRSVALSISDFESSRGAPPRAPAKAELFENDNRNLSDGERLERYTSADMKAWMAYLMPPGTKCMYIVSIAVAPAYQGNGVGSALIQRGTIVADVEGVLCWVHASEAGARAFDKAGFVEIGKLEIDLNEWNLQGALPPLDMSWSELVGSSGQNEGGLEKEVKHNMRMWGHYTLRYMLRMPILAGNAAS